MNKLKYYQLNHTTHIFTYEAPMSSEKDLHIFSMIGERGDIQLYALPIKCMTEVKKPRKLKLIKGGK